MLPSMDTSEGQLCHIKAMTPPPFENMNAKQACCAGSETTDDEIDTRCRVIRCPVNELRHHHSYARHQLSVSASQLSALAALGNLAFREPIVVTRNRTIIDGYARFQLAQRQERETLFCLEYDLTEEEALRWLIQSHRPSWGLNAFSRVLLVLDLEPFLQERARANQRIGGQHKGLSNLTEAQKVDSHSELAAAAGVSTGNVRKVKQLIESTHPMIKQALRAEEISIHLAWQWRRLPAQQQLEKFEEHRSRRGTNQTSRRLIQKHVARLSPPQLIPTTLGDLLEAFTPEGAAILDSIVISEIDAPGSIAYFTKSALHNLRSIKESKCETKAC
jgi:hypothetical protein